MSDINKRPSMDKAVLEFLARKTASESISNDGAQQLLEAVREEFDFDAAFVLENEAYPFELTVSAITFKNETREHRTPAIRLTTDDYRNLVDSYADNHLCESGDIIMPGIPGSVLHYGMTINQTLYGCVGFFSTTPRTWTDEERTSLLRIGRLLFRSVAKHRLERESDADYLNRLANITSATNSAFYINLQKNDGHGFLIAEHMKNKLPEWGTYSTELDRFCREALDPAYRSFITERFAPESLMEELSANNPVVEMEYPRTIGAESLWFKMTASLAKCDEQGRPLFITLTTDNITEEMKVRERADYVMQSVGDVFVLILSVDLNVNRYTVVKNSRLIADDIIASKPTLTEMVSAAVSATVHPDSFEHFKKLQDIDTLRGIFDGNPAVHSFDYRDQGKGEYCWLHLDLVPAHNYSPENRHITAYIRDITAERLQNEERFSMLASMRSIYFSLYTYSLEEGRFFETNLPVDTGVLYDGSLSNSELLDKLVNGLVFPESRKSLREFVELSTLAERLAHKKSISLEFRRTGHGWCRADIFPVARDDDGNVTRVVMGIVDIDESKRRELEYQNALEEEMRLSREMEFRAEHDPLTKLLNRNGFDRIVSTLENTSEPLCFMIVDVDKFKEVNDTYGHDMGDTCLTQVAQIITRYKRPDDYAFRFGGDEFALLLRNFQDPTGSSLDTLVGRINDDLGKPVDGTPPFSVSVGCALSTHGYYPDLYLEADEALYRVKTSQRGGCCVYSADSVAEDEGAIRKSAYSEPLYYLKNQPDFEMPGLQSNIDFVLNANGAVGIFCGFPSKDMPLFFASGFAINNLGYSLEMFNRKRISSYLDLVVPDDRGFYSDAFDTPCDGTQLVSTRTVRLLHENGVAMPYRETFVVEFNETGPCYWMSSLRALHEDESYTDFTMESRSNNRALDPSLKANAPEQCRTASWRMEFPPSGRNRMFGDKMFLAMMCAPEDITPEDLFEHWEKYVVDDYRDLVARTIQKGAQGYHAEAIYQWVSPVAGPRLIRCGGIQTNPESNILSFVGYHQDISETFTFNRQNDREMVAKSISDMYFCTYLISLENDTFSAYHEHDSNDDLVGLNGCASSGFERFIEKTVAPESRQGMKTFTDLSTLEERLRDEQYVTYSYLSTTHRGWCRARFVAAARSAEGKLTHVVFVVTSIDRSKRDEMHYNYRLEATNKKLRQQTEILNSLTANFYAVVFLDFATNRYLLLSDSPRLTSFAGTEGSLDTGLQSIIDTFVSSDTRSELMLLSNEEHRNRRMRNTDRISLRYHDVFNGWCETDISVPTRDDEGNPATAILTVRLLSEEEATGDYSEDAGFDRLTRAYTRSGMAKAAETYAETKTPVAAIQLSLSNLDQVNNRFGRSFGDEMLLKTYRLMREELGDDALIGRLGENEFMALIAMKQPALDEGILEAAREICQKLKNPQDGLPPINAHAGIASSPFGYTEQVHRMTDDALRYVREKKAFGAHVYTGSELSNPHVSLEDWTRLKAEEDDVLSLIDDQLRSQEFFAIVDLERNTYRFLQTKGLPGIDIPTSGVYSETTLCFKDMHPNGIASRSMSDLVTAEKIQEAFTEDRSLLVYEFTVGEGERRAWINLQYVCLKRKNGKAVRLLAGIRDITADRHDEAFKQQLPEMLYQVAYNAVYVIDRQTGESTLSKGTLPDAKLNADRMFDYREYVRNTAEQRIDADEMDSFLHGFTLENVVKKLDHAGHYELTHTYRYDDAQTKMLTTHFRYLGQPNNLIVAAVEDVTDRAELDSVTGEKNLIGFQRLASEIIEREGAEGLCVMHLNVKDFKNVNELLGFSYGDNVLRFICESLHNSTLNPLIVSRETGDKFFCLVRRENIDRDEIARLSELSLDEDGRSLRLHIEFGVYLPTGSENIRSACDKARFAASHPVQDNDKPYTAYDKKMSAEYLAAADVLMNAAPGLEKGEFKAYYQPIYDAATQRIASAEALVRWDHPQKGLLGPEKFIPLLEKRGIISEVDLSIFDQVEELQADRVAGSKHVIPLSVNLSRMDLVNSSMRGKLQNRIDKHRVTPDLIRFEITETAYVNASRNGVTMLDNLRNQGYGIMVDDFGSGYSSLGTLADHRFDIVKLDMSFVRLIGESTRSEMVIISTIQLCHNIGAHVVAEGVENRSQYEFLRDNGCDYIQGRYFSDPLSREEFEKLLDIVGSNE